MSAGGEEARVRPEALARRIAAVALDKKAHDVVVLDMRDVVAYTDFLVIATGNTERQTQAIEDGDLPGAEASRRRGGGACPGASRAARRRAGS